MLIKKIRTVKNTNKIKNLYFNEKFQIIDNINVFFFKLERVNFIGLSSNSSIYKFFKIPYLLHIKLLNNFLVISGFKSIHSKIFLRFLTYYLYNYNKIFYKKLILKGLGFRIFFYSKLNFIEFKLGFSHKKKVTLPVLKGFDCYVKKNILLFKGYNLNELGNFLFIIKKLKKENAYKEKGFWYQTEKKTLKIIKKL